MTPYTKYRTRSGVVPAMTLNGQPRNLSVGTEFSFLSEVPSDSSVWALVLGHDRRKYRIYSMLVPSLSTVVEAVLPVHRVYPDPKNPDEWYDNSPLVMFEPIR